MTRDSIRAWFLASIGAGCLLLVGCVSLQTKTGLPAEWQAAMAHPLGTDLSGDYVFRGEGDMVPDSRIMRYFPYPGQVYFQAKRFSIRRVDDMHIEVVIQDDRAQPFLFEVVADPKTGEVKIPAFSETWDEAGLPGASKVTVTLIKGHDGALYAKRTNYSGGSTVGILIPTAGIVSRWCRFAPVK